MAVIVWASHVDIIVKLLNFFPNVCCAGILKGQIQRIHLDGHRIDGQYERSKCCEFSQWRCVITTGDSKSQKAKEFDRKT